MSLRGFQQALAEMVASDALCRAVAADAPRTLARYDLTERERRRLEGMAAQRGMRVNQVLHRANRAAPVFSLLPLTCHLLDGHLRDELERFWATADGDDRFAVEVLRFGELVAGRSASGALAVEALDDALTFEMACLRLQLPPEEEGAAAARLPGLRVVRFGHDPLPLLQCLAARQPPPYDVARGEFWLLLDARAEDWQLRVIDPSAGRLLDAMQSGRATPSAADVQTLAAVGIALFDHASGE